MNGNPQLKDIQEHLLDRKELFSGNFLHVWCDTVKTASNLIRTREYVRHPGAAVIVPIFEDGSVLLEYQWRQPCETAFWELPAGKLDPEEDPLVCAKRELSEETGLTADEWHYLGKIHNAIGYSNEQLKIYVAKRLTQGAQHLDPGECLSLHRFKLSQALQMVQDGQITDVNTIIGLMWVERFLKGDWPRKTGQTE